jgi:hypothetical protein
VKSGSDEGAFEVEVAVEVEVEVEVEAIASGATALGQGLRRGSLPFSRA